jgi:protein required for attachment to host cells
MSEQNEIRTGRVWVIAADSSRARIFTAPSPSAELEERETLVNPEARLRDRDLISDAPGRTFSRASAQRSGMMSDDPKAHEIDKFAKALAQRLEQGRTHDEYDHLVLIAAPAFLGVLRETLDKQVLHHVALSMDKDLSQMSADELRARLPKRMV